MDVSNNLPENIFCTVQDSDANDAGNAIQRKNADKVSKDRMDEALLQMEALDKQLQIAEINASEGEDALIAENRNSSYVNEDETPRGEKSAGVPLGQHVQHHSQTIILDQNFKSSSPTSDETPNQAIVTDTATTIQNRNEVESKTHSPSNSNKMTEDDHDTWHSLTPSYLGIFGEIEVAPISSSVSYVGSSRSNGGGSGSTTVSESQSIMYGSIGTNSIARNMSLCSVSGRHRVGGGGATRLLTSEEEERITDMLDERDEDMERYGMTLTEKEMDVEVDGRLHEFGISFDHDDDDDDINNGDCDDDGGACEDDNAGVGDDGDNSAADGREETERIVKDVEKTSDKYRKTSVRGGQHHRDPVLKELAKTRKLEERERNIDKALRALMRAPLQSVIRCADDDFKKDVKGVATAEDADGTCSMTSSICSGRSILSASVTEKDIEELVQCCREGLEAENLEIADRISIRWLLDSLANSGGRKSLDGERQSLRSEMKVDALSQSSE